MGTLASLNSYANTSITFTVTTQTTSRTVGQSFTSPVMTWDVIRQLGPLSGSGVRIDYNVTTAPANTTVTFPNIAQATHTLTTSTPSAGVYRIQGMLDILDYNAAIGQINPPVGATGNVQYSQTYTNTNSATGNFVVTTVAVP